MNLVLSAIGLVLSLSGCVLVVDRDDLEIALELDDEQYIAEQSISEQSISEQSISEQFISEQSISEQSISEPRTIRSIETYVPCRIHFINSEQETLVKGSVQQIEKIDLQYVADTLIVRSRVKGLMTPIDIFVSSRGLSRLISHTSDISLGIQDNVKLEIDYINAASATIEVQGNGSLKVGQFEGDALNLRLIGNGKMVVGDVLTEVVSVEVEDQADLSLKGRAGAQIITLSDAAKYRAQNLQSQTAEISSSGFSSSHLWVDQNVLVASFNDSRVRHKGSAKVSSAVF